MSEIEKNILTKEGAEDLQRELKILIEESRPAVIEEIKEARAQGDLSENAEFDAAREKQGQIEDRINEIEAILYNSKVVKSAAKSSYVRIGSEIVIEDLRDGKKTTYNIVSPLEADPFLNKISNQSPLALSILNNEEGAEVIVNASSKYKIRIVSIKN